MHCCFVFFCWCLQFRACCGERCWNFEMVFRTAACSGSDGPVRTAPRGSSRRSAWTTITGVTLFLPRLRWGLPLRGACGVPYCMKPKCTFVSDAAVRLREVFSWNGLITTPRYPPAPAPMPSPLYLAPCSPYNKFRVQVCTLQCVDFSGRIHDLLPPGYLHLSDVGSQRRFFHVPGSVLLRPEQPVSLFKTSRGLTDRSHSGAHVAGENSEDLLER